MFMKLVVLFATLLHYVQGLDYLLDLGFISECDQLTPVDILRDSTEINRQAGQTVNKFIEFIEKDEELQSVLNSTTFDGVILVPQSDAILRSNAIPASEEKQIEQFRMHVIVGDQGEETRESLQGSKIIMGGSIVAKEEGGEQAQVQDVQTFGEKCANRINKFEVWIISDFLSLESFEDDTPTPTSLFTIQETTTNSSPLLPTSPPAPTSLFSPFGAPLSYVPSPSTPLSIPIPFSSENYAINDVPDVSAVSSISIPAGFLAQSSRGFDPTEGAGQNTSTSLEQQLSAPFTSPVLPPIPEVDPGNLCERGSPLTMMKRSKAVVQLAADGAQFLEDAANEAASMGDSRMLDYLNDEDYEGVILIPNNAAVQYYTTSPSMVGRYNNTEVAYMHIIPYDLNVDTLGPIENSLQGSGIRLIKDRYVENRDQRRSDVEEIDLVGEGCDQFEFWILRSRPVLPPTPTIPAPPPIDVASLIQDDSPPTPPPPIPAQTFTLPPPSPPLNSVSVFEGKINESSSNLVPPVSETLQELEEMTDESATIEPVSEAAFPPSLFEELQFLDPIFLNVDLVPEEEEVELSIDHFGLFR